MDKATHLKQYREWLSNVNELYGLKRYDEALAAYNHAIMLNPTLACVYVGKGDALSNLKRYDEAHYAYNRAIALDPNFALAYYNKSLLLDILQRPKYARAARKKARQLGYQG